MFENNDNNQPSYYPVYIENPVYQPEATPPLPPKKKKAGMFRKSLAVVTACAIFSFSAAFAGATLGKRQSDTGSTSGNSVIYQSVARTSINDSTSEVLSVADIAEMASVSVVEITTETVQTGSRFGQYVSEGAGSGVIITTDGYIVTNNHVIDGATNISVRLKNGISYDATLVGKDSQTDLAVLKIDVNELTPAVLGNSSTLAVGDLAVAIGNPLGELGGTVTDGIISALDREITIDGENMTLLQTSAAINPGNSGGGLFNEAGELIGIVNAKSSGSDVEGLGFAIPIDAAKPVITQLMENGYVSGRPSIGVTTVDISNTATAMRYGVTKTGVYVYKAASGSELQPGDLIVSIDGTAVSSSAEIKTTIAEYGIGKAVSITILRSNAQQTVSVTVTEQK